LQERGWTLGFSPAAMVWHHRRNSIRAYWKQQQGYGKAEALLEAKWPERYNAVGHISWAGRLYGNGLTAALRLRRGRIYQGTWGSALFQSVYASSPGLLSALPLMPEWWLVIAGLAALSLLSLAWSPLLVTLPLLLLAIAAPVAQAVVSARRARFADEPRTRRARLQLRGLTAALHLVQPVARQCGRLRFGLSPWRRRGWAGLVWPWRRTDTIWREQWQAPEEYLGAVETDLRASGAVVRRGDDYARWDLEVRGGLFGAARGLLAVEEHGGGAQLARFATWPRCSAVGIALILLLASLSAAAGLAGAWVATVALAVVTALLTLRIGQECAAATAAVSGAFTGSRADGS
jgi:membrane protein implicated in regulation of membrane protease activity